ncbi:hypothetical protein [Peribacillus alkalitolerans]|jgi:hypothetical protein|nr:hypothetical protein [Peribacillus alkalitolerans]
MKQSYINIDQLLEATTDFAEETYSLLLKPIDIDRLLNNTKE